MHIKHGVDVELADSPREQTSLHHMGSSNWTQVVWVGRSAFTNESSCWPEINKIYFLKKKNVPWEHTKEAEQCCLSVAFCKKSGQN